ncbi:pyocin knob domain-containing protein [Lactobacillus helveticus]|uniref:pyocin knob domain-containing protein n=1 Tax=Lactobacillus helveticus TaxID=1587 RepID=UPI001109D2D9|nr:pyocin knob domain-containing protein [Lactobacillus helveticus]TLQ21718.1 hypothetical protein FEZ38_06315 [Lactobacillus helveticus]
MQVFAEGKPLLDTTTKLINGDVDINTLTKEGNFFVKSSTINHFPANYQDQWYFLNVVSPIDADKIKQTVTPDATDRYNWILVRTGTKNYDGSVNWYDWLILDFSSGKLFHSK